MLGDALAVTPNNGRMLIAGRWSATRPSETDDDHGFVMRSAS